MNDLNEISNNSSEVNVSTLLTNCRITKRNIRSNSCSPRRSKRSRTSPLLTNNRRLSRPQAMGSLISSESTANELNNQNIESNEETNVQNNSQSVSNSVENETQINETNVTIDVCIDLTEDDSVVDENNAESDSDIQCISTVVRDSDSDLCIVRDIKRRNRLNRTERPPNQQTEQSADIIEIPKTPNSANESPVESKSGNTPIQKTIKCPVCLDDFSTFRVSGKQLVSTNCGHLFCDRCIKEVIKTSKSCPNCRKKIATQKSFHPIYL